MSLFSVGFAGLLALLPQQAAPDTYVRVAEAEAGAELRLEVCTRTFAREGAPTVVLVGAVHVAEREYYGRLRALTDQADLVLYEGVGDATRVALPAEALEDGERAEVTRLRLRAVGAAVVRCRRTTGRLPERLGDLAAGLGADEARRLLPLVVDAWGRPLLYEPDGAAREGFDLRSLGADGARGGEEDAADLVLSDLSPLTDDELDPPTGLQRDLARLLGLEFQLDVMRPGERWENCDMPLDELRARLEEQGGTGEQLLGMLSGEGFLALVGKGLFKLLGAFDQGGATMRLVMIEVLGRAEEMLSGDTLPGMSDLFDVLIVERNKVVVARLTEAAKNTETRSIAVLYGAGHLADIERALREQMGYETQHEEWLVAMRVHASELGTTADGMELLRRTIRIQLRTQLGGRKR